MPLFAVTIFSGAFLLFLVQPLIGKYILPWFGGGPGVWTTCLLFFQTLLLGGYAYAHALTKLSPRRQCYVHLGLLAVSLLALPITPGVRWQPQAGQEPVIHILILLTVTLGLPYLTLSATGPLLQRWFSQVHSGVAPYRLYALSNAGSLLALFGYPFVFEPWLPRALQGTAWSVAYAVFALLCGTCALRLLRLETTAEKQSATEAAEPEPPLRDRTLWFLLPAMASLLLVATTNKLCLDVAVVPFLWILPLGIYLLSFIVCFDHPRWYSRGLFSALLALGAGTLCYFFTARLVKLPLQITGYGLTLFAACMVSHGELYRLRPAPRHLTRFYLSIAAGGATGGMLVTLVAPMLLNDYSELQFGLVALIYLVSVIGLLYQSRSLVLGCSVGALALPLLIPSFRADGDGQLLTWLQSFGDELIGFNTQYWKEILALLVGVAVPLYSRGRIGAGDWRQRMTAAPMILTVMLGMIFLTQEIRASRNVEVAVRNFYGALKLREYGANDIPDYHFHLLTHGVTTHGLQFAGEERSQLPTSYYGATSGVGRALDILPGTRRVGLVGLGSGTLAMYGRPGDVFHFYEINPAIIDLAQNRFSYLTRSAATVEIAVGDARLVMEDELRRRQPGRYDALVLDAFSSDSIPVHLLTTEAIDLYLQHLRPGGIIAVHVSNRYLNLRPVVEELARQHHLACVTIEDRPDPDAWWLYGTTWILLSSDGSWFTREEIRSVVADPAPAEKRPILWTDNHASLFEIIR